MVRSDLTDIGADPAMLATPAIDRLARDIGDGFKLEITGTPAYVIDGQVHLGQIPPEIFDRVQP